MKLSACSIEIGDQIDIRDTRSLIPCNRAMKAQMNDPGSAQLRLMFP